jgi:hypothetical protein
MAAITLASGANHGLRYVAEAVPGTTPSTPKTAALAHNSCSLGISRETMQPNALRDDRMMADARSGTNKIAGTIECDFGAEEYDPLLEAALAGMWANNVLKAGKNVHSFTFERAFTDIGQYAIFTGCFVNQFSLSVKPSAFVTASFDILGLAGEYKTSALAVPAASKNPAAFDSFTGELQADGTALAIVTGIELSLSNGLEPNYAIFSRDAAAVRWGRSQLTGTLSAFFTDAALLRKFLDDTPVALSFTLERGGAQYAFTIPRLFYTGAETAVQGEDVISLSLPWQASLDATLGTSFQITRTLPTSQGV